MYAVDLSSIAVAYARQNAGACGVDASVQLLQGSWGEPLEAAGLAGGWGGGGR